MIKFNLIKWLNDFPKLHSEQGRKLANGYTGRKPGPPDLEPVFLTFPSLPDFHVLFFFFLKWW